MIIDSIYSYYLKQDEDMKEIVYDDTIKALKGDRDEII